MINANIEFFVLEIKFTRPFAGFSDNGGFVLSFSGVVISIKRIVSDVILHLGNRSYELYNKLCVSVTNFCLNYICSEYRFIKLILPLYVCFLNNM